MAQTLMGPRSAQLPTAGREQLLGLLEADHDRIGDLLALLKAEGRPAARACLAKELMRTCSAAEDVRMRTVYRNLYRDHSTERHARDERCSRIRLLLKAIDAHTHRVLPSNVHAHDGEGFEDTVRQVVMAMTDHLAAEKQYLHSAVEAMSEATAAHLAQAVLRARRTALTRPHAHMGSLRRSLRRQLDRLHDIDDAPDYFLRDFRIELRRAG